MNKNELQVEHALQRERSSRSDYGLSGSTKSSSWTEITLADDLRINLQTMHGSTSTTFDLNGKDFGPL
jgi:hypothetical protein